MTLPIARHNLIDIVIVNSEYRREVQVTNYPLWGTRAFVRIPLTPGGKLSKTQVYRTNYQMVTEDSDTNEAVADAIRTWEAIGRPAYFHSLYGRRGNERAPLIPLDTVIAPEPVGGDIVWVRNDLERKALAHVDDIRTERAS